MIFSLNRKSVGIDIADRSVEAVELEKTGSKIRLVSAGRAVLPAGVVERGKIIDADKLKIAVEEALKTASPRPIAADKIIFGMPESRLYSHVFDLPAKKKKSLLALVEEEARVSIPIKTSDLLYSYKIISEAKGGDDPRGERVLLIGSARKSAIAWQEFFAKLGMEIEMFDVETLAAGRGLAKEFPDLPHCIVDIGSVTTNISIFHNHGLYYSYTLRMGGDDYTRLISESRETADGNKISLEEAEKLKIAFGLSDEDKDHKEIAQLIKAASAPIIEEVKAALEYFQEKTGERVAEIILVGGTANLKGIFNCFASCLLDKSKKEVPKAPDQPAGAIDMANIAINVGKPAVSIKSDALLFVEAIGLALKPFDAKADKIEPHLSPSLVKERKTEAPKAVSGPVEPDEEAGANWFKAHPKELQLAAVLLSGVLLIAGAFWYRGYSTRERLAKIAAKTASPFAFTAVIPVEIQANASTGVMASGQIRARHIAKTVDKAMSYDEAVALAKSEAAKELKKGEVLWKEPFQAPRDKDKLVFPLSLKWLAYPEAAVSSQLLIKIKEELKGKGEFIVKSSQLINIVPHETASSTIYVLSAMMTVNTNKQLDYPGIAPEAVAEDAGTREPSADASGEDKEPAVAETEAPAASSTAMTIEDIMAKLRAAREKMDSQGSVLINDLPGGSLNIRSGPGADFPVAGQAVSGTKYRYLGSENAWLKIEIPGGEEGWVSERYASRTAD